LGPTFPHCAKSFGSVLHR